MDIDEIFTSNNLLKWIGWIFVLSILSTIAFVNGEGLNKTPMYIYAIISWITIITLPYILNQSCEGPGNKYYCLGEIKDPIDDTPEDEQLGISLQRSLGNIITTLIYFGFSTRAIANYHNASPFKGSSSVGAPNASESFKNLTTSLSNFGPFSSMIYMAIIIIIINVISNMYIYCM